MLTLLLDFGIVLGVSFVLFVAFYGVVRLAFKAVELYTVVQEWAYPRPRKYQLFWRSRVGSPPHTLPWKATGRDLFTMRVEAPDPDEAMGIVSAAYEAAQETGYPHVYAPEFVSCQEIITDLGESK